MASECDRPKKDDPPPKGTSKGDKGKSEKGKSKGEVDDGKDISIKKVGEAAEVKEKETRELKTQDSDPKEPDAEPKVVLSEFEKTIIKTLKEKKPERSPKSIDDMDTIIETLRLFDGKVKTIRIKRVGQEQIKYGLLDSGATHNVRAIRSDEDYESLVPVEVQVAFDSEVKTELFMNREGAIIGPKGTETIVSVHEVVRAG